MSVEKRKTRKNRKEEILSAALFLVAKNGTAAATIRAIASVAGVTEGAIYRHFPNKESLIRSIYQRIVREMVEAKEEIVKGPESLSEKLHKWIQVTFEYYDEHPDAFVFLYLTPHNFVDVDGEIIDRQGELFMEMIREAQADGQARSLDPALALSHFLGLELSVPRLIHENRLPPPARQYASEVKEALLRVFAP